MNSPFFWRNLGILFIVVANFVFIIKVLLSQKRRSDFSGRPIASKIILRAISILYVTTSFIILLLAVIVFYSYEWSDDAQQSWKNSRKWADVKVGQTQQEVVQILGSPDRSGKESAPFFVDKDVDDVYIYPMSRIRVEGGLIEFKNDSLKEMRVISKYPDDEIMSRYLADWDPPDYIANMFSRNISELACVISFVGLVLLALASLIPWGLRNGWYSWTLYTPLIALNFGSIYEMNITAGWRFDLFLLLPVYALIIACWLFRFVKAVRLHNQKRGAL